MHQLLFVNFLTVFQLLAGIGLLFFYDDILKKIVEKDSRTKCLSLINDMRSLLQTEFSESDVNLLYQLVDVRIKKQGGYQYWYNYKNAVSFTGKLIFVFLFLILLLGSHETTSSPLFCYGWILVADIVLILTVIIAFCYRSKFLVSHYWGFVCPSLIIVGLFILTFFTNYSPLSPVVIIYVTFATVFFMAVFIVGFYYYDNHRAFRLSKRLESLKGELDAYRRWTLLPLSFSRYECLPIILKSKIGFHCDPVISEEIVSDYIREEIHKLLKGHKTMNFVVLSKCVGVKNYFCDPNRIAALFIVFLVVSIFIIEWSMLFFDK